MQPHSFDPNDFIPKANNWFSTQLFYSGWGHAEFLNPSGWVEGSVEIQVDETGEVSIQMEVVDFFVDPPLGAGSAWANRMWLLEGTKPTPLLSGQMFGVGIKPRNKCLNLTVWTREGTFETLDDIRYYRSEHEDSLHLVFDCMFSGYKVYEAKFEKCWVLPLSNFVSSIPIRQPYLGVHPLDRHPLRIFPTPIVPDEIKDDERKHAFLIANGRNAIVPFMFKDKLGFIEALPDYHDRQEKLINGTANIQLTAVLVGEVSDAQMNFEQVLHWIPLDFLLHLSLATGRLVGAPWIEIRDAEGSLVRQSTHSSG